MLILTVIVHWTSLNAKLSMGNAHKNLSMGNSQGTRVFIVSQWKLSIGQPLMCLLSMDNGHPLIASTLNGQLDILYLGRKGDKKIQ